MVSSPSQDWPDGGPRQYDDIAGFSWLTISPSFWLFIQIFGLNCYYDNGNCRLKYTGTFSCPPLDIPLCIQFEELINLNPTYFTAESNKKVTEPDGSLVLALQIYTQTREYFGVASVPHAVDRQRQLSFTKQQ